MSVILLSIKFNHDPTSVSTNAVNIRKNVREFVPVPEWRQGFSVNPGDSVAAYAIKETRGNKITIKAKFALADPSLRVVEVRAVQPSAPIQMPLWLHLMLSPLLPWPTVYYYYLTYFNYLWQISLGSVANVLGDVKAKAITFGEQGETDFETFELQNVGLWDRGVGIHYMTWRWQYRRGPGFPWIDFAATNHKIYTVLQVPKSPWVQLPYTIENTQLPWVEVLDYACRWAMTTHTLDDAATKITRAVYNLGPTVIQYGCPILAATQYSILFFDCTAFLERLRGGIGNGIYVNCTDCATIVSTFANALGCELWQSRMGPALGFFATNPILAIGTSRWELPCGFGQGFNYHEVAWKGDCTSAEEVFDACLEVNGSLDPTRPPFIPLLPTNLLFGGFSAGSYQNRLASPAGRLLCTPQPFQRKRRIVI